MDQEVGIRLHPRTRIVTRAEIQMGEAIDAIVEEHSLTITETFICLTRYMQLSLKYALRSERHPDDPDKKGDEA